VPEDRFGDLGRPSPGGSEEDPAAPPGRSAADRLAELDERDLAKEGRKPQPQRSLSSRYAWVVGVALILATAVLGTYLIRSAGGGTAVLGGPIPGGPLPVFAAPEATGDENGSDANIRQSERGSASAGGRPACEVRGPGIVNLCELRGKPLVLSLIVTRGADCEPQLDRLARVRAEFPDVNFAAVVSGQKREEVEKLARSRGWSFPVAVDRDGALVNLYRVGVCPTTTFAFRGGKVRETRLGNLSEDELRRSTRALAAGTPAPRVP